MSKQIAIYQSERILPVCDHLTAISRLTSDIGGKYGLFTETIWNSYEHGEAKNIWITVSGRGTTYEVVILDDGRGMDSARRQRSLNLAQTAEKQTGRNYQDLGLKRLAADFEHVCVYTISQEERKATPQDYPMWVMDYGFDELLAILAGRSSQEIVVTPKKPDWKEMGLLRNSTGTRIHLSGSRDGRPRFTAEKLRRELADHLPLDLVENVNIFINDEPLERRKVVGGKPFRLTRKHPKLGKIVINLYIPQSRSVRDRLMIGSYESVCDWRSFATEITDETSGDRLGILGDGVYGEILVEAFKGYVTASRREFEISLFGTNLIPHFVDFLEAEVCPELEQMLGLVKDQQETERDQRILNQLREYVSMLGDQDKIRQKQHVHNVLAVSPSSVEVVPSDDPVKIEVVKYNQALTLKWDTSACGGRVEISSDKQRVTYYPGNQLGEDILICSYEEDPDTQALVEIEIVSEKKLRISPHRIGLYPGDIRLFRAENWEDTTSGEENLRWRLRDDPNGRFIVSIQGEAQERENGYGAQATYQAGNTPGQYSIELYDIKDRKSKSLAFADITVIDPIENPRQRKKAAESDVLLEGIPYEIGFEYLENSPKLSRLYRGKGKRQLRINRCHPACLHAERVRSESGLFELALTQLLMRHVDEEAIEGNEQLTPEEKTDRFGDLYKKLAEEYEERSDRK